MTVMAPMKPGHAGGWSWRKNNAGRIDRPWSTDNPPQVYGLCESGWHNDCPQAPTLIPIDGCCSCPCHQGAQP